MRFNLAAFLSANQIFALSIYSGLDDIDREKSKKRITNELLQKNQTNKPGRQRLSLHPIMTNKEFLFICDVIQKWY
jgi:hypothetical protein